MKTTPNMSPELQRLFLCLIADEYAPEETHDLLSHRGADYRNLTKKELREVIRKRLWSQKFYLGLTGFEFETEDGFYTYLEEIWQYVFNDGPMPQVEKYWY